MQQGWDIKNSCEEDYVNLVHREGPCLESRRPETSHAAASSEQCSLWCWSVARSCCWSVASRVHLDGLCEYWKSKLIGDVANSKCPLFIIAKVQLRLRITQGNYVTWDSSGMCHLMPLQHLPEWREEEERAFVHRGSWIPNKDLDNTMPATVNCIYMKSLWSDDTLENSVTDSGVIAWFRPEQPQCTTARSSSFLHSGRCCFGIKWHMSLLSWVA